MLKKLIFNMSPISENIKIPPSLSYKIFSFICGCEEIDADFKNLLHTSDEYISQYITVVNGNMFWNINLLNSVAVNNLFNWLLNLKTIELDCISFNISLMEVFTLESVVDLQLKAEEYFKNTNLIKIKFNTPFSFRNYEKRNYMLFPEETCLFHSIVSKWSLNRELSSEFSVYDEDMISMISDGIFIYSYNLKSYYFNFKNIKVPASKGDMIISLKKLPVSVKKLVYILLYYMQFSGIGTHTSLGMGGCSIESYNYRKSSQTDT